MLRYAMLLGLLAVTAGAQEKGFAVGSVKANRSGDPWFHSTPVRANVARFNATNISLQRLLLIAYGIEASMLEGGPNWLDSEKFDVDAKGGSASTAGDVLMNLQSLLAERFLLRTHWISKEMPVYSLVAAKGGPKLHTTACPPDTDGAAPDGAAPCGGARFAMGGFHAKNTPISILVRVLTEVTGRPVLDQTGLTGNYDFDLMFTARIGPRGGGEQVIEGGPDPTGTSIFNSLPEQLGLKLVGGKGTVRTLAIDHAERPSAN